MLQPLKKAALFLLFLVAVTAAYTCVNQGEGSHCASPDAPGGLTPSETPQFIVITFDDALHQPSYDYTEKLLGYGHKNPNGAPLPVTYFVSNEYSDYHLIQRRYAQGCEIGVHTLTHTTSTSTSYDTWAAEIKGCKKALSALAQIPEEDIVGFRAPYLAYNDASMNVLHDNGFLYDASITEKLGGLSISVSSYIWPYTFDNLGAQKHDVGGAPKQEYPGLWEVPMWSYYKGGAQQASMDYPGGHSDLLAMFKEHFTERYNGNRAPQGVFLHPGWLMTQSHADALNDFLAWALQNDDVWVVTNHQLVQWMKDPHKSSEMASFEPVQYQQPAAGAEVPDGWDNNGNGSIDENTVHTCVYGNYRFNTNEECPAEYPSPEAVVTRAISIKLVGDSTFINSCDDPDWSSSVTYNYGDLVAYNGHTYFAKWNNSNTKPGAQWGPWEDRGICGYYEIAAHGKVSPVGNKVHVEHGESITFTLTPDAGYAVSYIILDGEDQPLANSVTINNVTTNKTLEIGFALDDGGAKYQSIHAAAGSGGRITPAGTISVLYGGFQNFTITANDGHEINDVLINGESRGALSSYKFSNITGDSTIEANFSVVAKPTYTVTSAAGANGSISPVGNTIVTEGDSVVYTVNANSGYHIEELTVDGVSVGAKGSYTLRNITSDKSVNVTFAENAAIEYDIVATAGVNGTITPAGTTTLFEGESQSFTITANAGYHVADLTVDGVSVGVKSSYTVQGITKDVTLHATFAEDAAVQYDIVATAEAGGSISPAGTTTVNEGAAVQYTITADAGYEIASVLVDDVNKGAISSYTFNAIKSDATISASFTEVDNGTGGLCDGVAYWNAATNWTAYKIGDRRVNDGRVWEVTNTAFSFYEPSGPYGRFGWKELGSCD